MTVQPASLGAFVRRPDGDAPWTPFGVSSETRALARVLLLEPPRCLPTHEDPDDHLLLEWPNAAAWRAEFRSLVVAYEEAGCEVTVAPGRDDDANLVFLRDLIWMTPWGAVVGRPAPQARAGSEAYALQVLAAAGVPILTTITAPATFEGADAIWLSDATVAVGVGIRTDGAAVDQLRAVLAPRGVEVLTVPISSPGQHLLGQFNIVAEGLACASAARRVTPLVALARRHGYEVVMLDHTEEIESRWSLNWVVLGSASVLMPAGCPATRRSLDRLGVDVVEVDLANYRAAAGGPACATAILRRW